MNQHLELLDKTAPIVKAKVTEMLARAEAKHNYSLLIVFAYRSGAEQYELLKKGRQWSDQTQSWVVVDKSQVVTNAAPESSAHCVVTVGGDPAAVGVDIIPLDTNGKPLWPLPNETPEAFQARWLTSYKVSEQDAWNEIYILASKVGLDALGDPWGKFLKWDKGHFEEPGWDVEGVLASLGLKPAPLAE